MNDKEIEKYNSAVEEYIARLQWQNLSKNTIGNYEASLKHFGDFLSETDADDLYEAVEMWKEDMLRRGNKPSTVSQRLTDLSIFFGKACKRSFPKAVRYGENPVEEVELPKVIKTPYAETLTDEQIKKLFVNKPYHGARNWAKIYAIICILVNEKIRNAELLDLRLSDVDMQYHELVVRSGKGRKMRVVDLSKLSETAICAYLNSGIRPAYLTDEDYLFGTVVDGKWQRGTRQGLSMLVEHHIKEVCGVSGQRSHSLRHAGARLSLNAGASMEELQSQLGHSQMTTTAIYSGRLLARRRRESAQSVLAARDEAARHNAFLLEQSDGQFSLLKGVV